MLDVGHVRLEPNLKDMAVLLIKFLNIAGSVCFAAI